MPSEVDDMEIQLIHTFSSWVLDAGWQQGANLNWTDDESDGIAKTDLNILDGVELAGHLYKIWFDMARNWGDYYFEIRIGGSDVPWSPHISTIAAAAAGVVLPKGSTTQNLMEIHAVSSGAGYDDNQIDNIIIQHLGHLHMNNVVGSSIVKGVI